MDDFVLRGGTVVSLDPAIGILARGDVLVSGGRFERVAARIETDAEVIDATDRIVMPGFVDSHRHTWQSTLRGLLPNCTLGEYFGSVMIGAGPLTTPEDVYAATLLGSYEMLNGGITSAVDWANITNSPEHADAGVEALQEANIRATYSYGWPGGAEYLLHSDLPHPEDARRVAGRYFSGKDQLLTFGLALRGPLSSPPEIVVNDWELARDLDARITVHTGMRVPGVEVEEITTLDGLGLLGSDTTYVHCNNCSDNELRRISDTGGSVSVSAYSEMLMGHGRPPTGRLRAHGLSPSLSADVVVSVPGDMFSHMRCTYTYDRIQAFSSDPSVPFAPSLTAEDILRFATVNGAASMGLEDRVGTISPGKDADFVLLRTDMVNTMPGIDPIATVVVHADVSNVDAVYVRGRAVKKNGRLCDVDLSRLRQLAESSRDRLLAKMGKQR